MPSDSKKNEYKGISKRVRSLLQREEDYDVEFKESLNALDNSDIVAFANSDKGGSILVGIRETKTSEGRRVGEIIGCRVGDGEKLKIINKAESCVPPVDIEIFVENSRSRPFYRIEIVSGNQKPYCTLGGNYRIRGDGANKALLPGRLLSMFMEAETRQFVDRFKQATQDLESSLEDARFRIIKALQILLEDIQRMESQIHSSLEEISGYAADAADSSSEAHGFSDETLGQVYELDRRLELLDEAVMNVEFRMRALLERFNMEDPCDRSLQARVKKFIREDLVKRYRGGITETKENDALEILRKTFRGALIGQLSFWLETELRELKRIAKPRK